MFSGTAARIHFAKIKELRTIMEKNIKEEILIAVQ
tara:strand:- start:356 stop:460 length:105 start_codon:yes stop_codon:yes gene_type:complete